MGRDSYIVYDVMDPVIESFCYHCDKHRSVHPQDKCLFGPTKFEPLTAKLYWERRTKMKKEQ